ncbi:BolA/IbaG family iron-sulfur metabolism protein [Porticoccus sp. W117]|uniref:BolA family protein n=1 Tax=Porticoccus sp. W117 TaxID=3054777 RepID=UPI0025980B18|nr:BolA/IbaG family iron-sulfur metabolism protein [Porticoccus sp. W117]MDM3869794.1 BolA/IbaG family iron-sulfur metabolism protein [Porticoccus sp. W117]
MSIQQQIEEKLQREFSPSHLQVINESHMHSVPANSETHFKVVMATENFTGKRQVQRHQAVYRTLSEELAGEVHALALHTYSPEEWGEVSEAPASPNCMGGSKGG